MANDVTMRDYQYRTHQWLPGKNWAASTPLGPFLVTPDEVGDPHELDISLELNGERMQSAQHEPVAFSTCPTIVATISEFVPLAPGDVVLTGTPSGVGYRRDPKVLLRDGDRVVVEIERVGRLENPVAGRALSRARARRSRSTTSARSPSWRAASGPRTSRSGGTSRSPGRCRASSALLDEIGLRATFFVEGRNTELYPDTLVALAAAGHEVGYHGWCHEQWAELSPPEEAALLRRGVDAHGRARRCGRAASGRRAGG